VHPHYRFIVVPKYHALQKAIDETNQYILDDGVCVTDESVLAHEP
jgi:hypothetical protein